MRTIYVSPEFPLNRRMRKDIRRGKLQVVREGGERSSLGGGIPSGKRRGLRTTGSPLVCMADNGAEVGGGVGDGAVEQSHKPQDRIDAERIFRGLLQWNYFPRAALDYMPPVFTTEEFTPEIAKSIARNRKYDRADKTKGFDCVGYTQARFNLIPRDMSIPHPAGYAPLCLFIRDKWDENISRICGNTHSVVVPREYGDGRVLVMSYGDDDEWEPEKALNVENKVNMGYSVVRPRNHQDGRIIVLFYQNRKWEERWMLDHSFGMRFSAMADIANCYPSIYTHAVCWAEVGAQEAKKQQSGSWSNEWDKRQRVICRNETKGIPIGPGTSVIFSEFILQKVDMQMQEKMLVQWRRAIDDYHVRTRERVMAENFLRHLRVILGKFSLQLNPRKTKVLELPNHLDDSWMLTIEAIADAIDWSRISSVSLKRLLDHAALLAKDYPDRSVLKYTVSKIVLKKIREIEDKDKRRNAYCSLIPCLINFAFHYPALVSILAKPIKWLRENGHETMLQSLWSEHRDKMHDMLDKGVEHGWSDVVSWVLHYFILFNDAPEGDVIKKMIDSKDCLPMTLLFMMPKHRGKVQNFARGLIQDHGRKNLNCYELDKQWLLLYQMFWEGEIGNPYPKSDPAAQCLAIMKEQGVNFLKMEDGYIHPSEVPPVEDPFEF